MSTEALSASNGFVLAPRAAIAQLTLQLRASMHEIAAAEADHAAIDQDAAVAQLRARLAPLMDARRRTLDEAIVQAEADAAEAVEAARLEASTMAAVPMEEDSVALAVYDDIGPDETTEIVRYEPASPGAPTINIVIDAEAFARVIASVLGEHLSAAGEHPRPTCRRPLRRR